ncbi:MAG: hypothetical protein M3O67_08125 [Bacteroidota bacterium]|nr:hypothetical protein [Bacteroidota bacterium]
MGSKDGNKSIVFFNRFAATKGRSKIYQILVVIIATGFFLTALGAAIYLIIH